MSDLEIVYKKLNDMNIQYEVIKHQPAFTVLDIKKVNIPSHVIICKNLFLCDKDNYYLVILDSDKRANIKDLPHQIGSKRLNFASSLDLYKYLKVRSGEVSPLGIINDVNHEVNIVIDKYLIDKPYIGIHPNDNTITIILSFIDLERLIKNNENKIYYVDI